MKRDRHSLSLLFLTFICYSFVVYTVFHPRRERKKMLIELRMAPITTGDRKGMQYMPARKAMSIGKVTW
jgi:hypothetical protein